MGKAGQSSPLWSSSIAGSIFWLLPRAAHWPTLRGRAVGITDARCTQRTVEFIAFKGRPALHFLRAAGTLASCLQHEDTLRYRAAHERQSRASSRPGRRYRLAPPGAMPAAGIGLELVASITMPSTAHLPMSELGDLSLPRGREGVPQRLLRHQAGPTHQLGGVRYAVDRWRPPSPPGRAGTRGYVREPQTHA